jgi:integrase/recombinase XerD
MIGVGQVLFAFFEDYLKTQKGLRPGSVRRYRDTMKLFLGHVAASCRRPIWASASISGCRRARKR